jgi:hypothetical protein
VLDLNKIEKLLEREGAKLILELQAMMVSTGANASGRTSKSLEVITRNTDTSVGMSIQGGIGWKFVEQGRGATRRSGDGAVYKAIKQWIDDKGITPETGVSKDALAFLITRAIHQRGTLLNLLGERREVYTNVITDQYIDKIVNEIGNEVQVQVASDIIDKFIG